MELISKIPSHEDHEAVEVDVLCEDSAEAQRDLRWAENTSIREQVRMMIPYDLKHGSCDGAEP